MYIHPKHRFFLFASFTSGVDAANILAKLGLNSDGVPYSPDLPNFIGCFTRVGGLKQTTEIKEWKTGCMEETTKEMGITRFDNITADEGVSPAKDLLYRLYVHNGSVQFNLHIVVLDNEGNESIMFVAKDGWVKSFNSGDLDATSQDPYVQSVEIPHGGLITYRINKVDPADRATWVWQYYDGVTKTWVDEPDVTLAPNAYTTLGIDAFKI